MLNFSEEQQLALSAMQAFLLPSCKDSYFLLQGGAGTGKTYTLQGLLERFSGRVVYTAPTNKAVRVLRDTLSRDDYKPECKTLYSLLGLRMEPNGTVRVLVYPEDPTDLSSYNLIVVDEGSMLSSVILSHLQKAVALHKLKVIVMADAAQLPPVGEKASLILGTECGSSLKKVMRYDNQILKLATSLRECTEHPAPSIRLIGDNEAGEGVWVESKQEIEKRILDAVEQGMFSQPCGAKAIAWRNVTVEALNKLIRNRLFKQPEVPWLPEDRVIVMEPAKDLEGNPVAMTDDEGTVVSATETVHPLFPQYPCWEIRITLDSNKLIVLHVLHEKGYAAFAKKLEEILTEVKTNKKLWKTFWAMKDAFHKLRHAYAITAHRSQGSTYDTVFVDWKDILLNRDRQEAFKCLYVACTRAKRRVFLG